MAAFREEVELVNLNDVRTDGPCLGCVKCWYDHQCVYKDDFVAFMKTKVLRADIIVLCGAIRDRFLSSTWKTFLDRSFCNGHVPWLPGRQVAFLVSGPLSQMPFVREILQGFFEVLEANFAGIVTDENGDSEQMDGLLEDLAQRLVHFSERGYVQPATFLGTASRLTFREVFWGRFRFPFVADYRDFFKKEGRAFPHRRYKERARNAALMLLSRSPAFRKRVTKNMTQLLLRPLGGIVEEQAERPRAE
jgi:hypothetical protein